MIKTRVRWPNRRYQYVDDAAEAVSKGARIVGKRTFPGITTAQPVVQPAAVTVTAEPVATPDASDDTFDVPKRRGRPAKAK